MDKTPVHDHPVLKEMMAYGLADTQQIFRAFNVYLDLCEVKGFWNVKCHKCSALNLVFLSGHANRSEPRELILPVSCDSQLSPATLQTYTEKVKLQGYNTHGLVLAICASDSSIVYYRVTDGLVQPESPEETIVKQQIRTNRVDMERNHVRRHTADYIAERTKLTENDDRKDKQDIVNDIHVQNDT